MRKFIACTVIVIIMLQLLPITHTYGAPSDWAEADIEALKDEAIIKQGLFGGYNQLITREVYAYLVYKLIESYGISISSLADLSMDFNLIDTQNFYVIGLYKAGIITGYPDHTYRPEQPITRQEICTLYVKAIELIGGTFDSDESLLLQYGDEEKITNWARTSIAKAVNMGILKGTSSNEILPLGYSTVEESLVILNRILENKGIQVNRELSYNTVNSHFLDYHKGIGYFLDYQLNGSINSIKAYEDFDYIQTYHLGPLTTKFQVGVQGIYYIQQKNLMLYDFFEATSTKLIEEVDDFGIIGSEIYYLQNGEFSKTNIQDISENQVIFESFNNLVDLRTLIDAEGVIKEHYLLDHQGTLYQVHQGTITIVATGVNQFEVMESKLYYINDTNELIHQIIGGETREILESNVTDFHVVGNNLLYIIEGTWLYTTTGGNEILLYTGKGLRMACDYNYLVLTETVVGGSDFNHLIALFNAKEYLEY